MITERLNSFSSLRTIVVLCMVCLVFAFTSLGSAKLATASSEVNSNTADEPLLLVVMDPLCDKLACDCVEGYAQRKYERLAEYLQQKLQRKVDVVFGESIAGALDGSTRQPDILIGKHSVIVSGSRDAELKIEPVGKLTSSEGTTTQSGLIVVRQNDAAQAIADLQGYRVFFGPADCDEKSAAPMQLLRESGIAVPDHPEVADACSSAAKKLLELDADVKAAAVISSYAAPLLEGCGTIRKGELRVVGETGPLPFVTAFVNSQLTDDLKQQIQNSLLNTFDDAELLTSLQSLEGFVEMSFVDIEDETDDSRPKSESASQDTETAASSAKKK